jgi:hypothetical protein
MTEHLLADVAPSWLRRAAEPTEVARAIEACVPDFGPGGYLLDDVGLSWRLREHEDSWRGTVRVTWRIDARSEPQMARLLARLEADGGSPTSNTGGVRFATPGWGWRLPELGISLWCEADVGLPTLPWLTDADRALPVLTPILRPAHDEGPEIIGCTPTVLRYKHGSRCTVGYRLQVTDAPSPGSIPTAVVAKTYAGQKGEIAHEAMQALWSSDLRHSTAVTIAEPLGYDPTQHLLLQNVVPGDQTLKALTLDWFAKGTGDFPYLERLIRATARGLADLHRSGVSVGQERVWQEDLEELTSRRDRVVGAIPAVGSYAAELIDALIALDRSSAPDPVVPTHGSFRAAQVLVSGDDIAFIDFDSFAQAEPALDVAEFAFRLEQLALVKSGAGGGENPDRVGLDRRRRVDQLTTAFLDEYRSVTPVNADRVALWWAVGALSLVFSSFTKLKLSRLPACAALVDRVAERHGLPRP